MKLLTCVYFLQVCVLLQQLGSAVVPTQSPTSQPTAIPSCFPTSVPTCVPSSVPSIVPSSLPSTVPSCAPSAMPTSPPSVVPTCAPSSIPSGIPSSVPSVVPSSAPTSLPSVVPTCAPSTAPSQVPSSIPSNVPSNVPSSVPSVVPTQSPTCPSSQPTNLPSSVPSNLPSSVPSALPTSVPTAYSQTTVIYQLKTVMEGLTEEMFDETAQFVFKKTLASTVSDLREDEVKIIKAQTVEPTSALSSTFSFFHLLSPKLEVDWEIKVKVEEKVDVVTTETTFDRITAYQTIIEEIVKNPEEFKAHLVEVANDVIGGNNVFVNVILGESDIFVDEIQLQRTNSPTSSPSTPPSGFYDNTHFEDGGIGNPPMSMQQFSWMTGIGGCILVGLPIFLMWHRRRGYLKEKALSVFNETALYEARRRKLGEEGMAAREKMRTAFMEKYGHDINVFQDCQGPSPEAGMPGRASGGGKSKNKGVCKDRSSSNNNSKSNSNSNTKSTTKTKSKSKRPTSPPSSYLSSLGDMAHSSPSPSPSPSSYRSCESVEMTPKSMQKVEYSARTNQSLRDCTRMEEGRIVNTDIMKNSSIDSDASSSESVESDDDVFVNMEYLKRGRESGQYSKSLEFRSSRKIEERGVLAQL